eukprot:7389873-Prymnesium_polylepis.3
MEEAAAADCRPHVTRPAGPPRTPSPRTALSPRVRASRGRRERVSQDSQPSPPGAAAVPPRARATRRAWTAYTCT